MAGRNSRCSEFLETCQGWLGLTGSYMAHTTAKYQVADAHSASSSNHSNTTLTDIKRGDQNVCMATVSISTFAFYHYQTMCGSKGMVDALIYGKQVWIG